MRKTLTAAVAATLLIVLAGPASAHNDEAVLAVEAQEPSPLGAHLEISARYTNDNELVADAVIAVTATGPGGETVGLTPLTAVPDTEGLYTADLTFPTAGAWSLQVDATTPEGALAVPVEVAQPTTTTAEATSTTSASTSTAGDANGDAQGSGGALPWMIGGAVLVAGAAGAVVLVRRRGTGA